MSATRFDSSRGVRLRAAAILSLLCIGCAAAFGQTLTSITGNVSDASGAFVPNVSITLENTNRGASRSTLSDSEGRYSFVQILPGTYRLTAKAPGFANVIIEPLELLVNTPANVNVELRELRGVNETITVGAQAAQVNTADASLGNVDGFRTAWNS